MSFVVRIAAAAFAFIPMLALSPVSAQEWPAKPVRIIVPFGVGGPADIYARQVSQHLTEAFKQPFVVENRPGAGSIIGTTEVMKAAPDGHTLLVMSNTHTTNETMTPKKPFVLMRDFVPITPINYSDIVMIVHPSVKANNLKEFLALVRANPGKFNYASSGVATPYHMAGEMFKLLSSTDIVHVPHKASGDMRTAVIGGHVHAGFDAITTMAPNIRAGKVRVLGTSSANRSSVMPEVPTIAEGGVPGYDATIWLGLMAPTGTPKNVVARLNAEVQKIMQRPDIKASWAKQGAVALMMSPEEFDAYLRRDIDKWGKVVRAAKLIRN